MDGAVWAINPLKLNRGQLTLGKLLQPGHPEVKALVEEAFAEWSGHRQRALAIVTEEIDIRMLVQLSAFTIHAPLDPLEVFPDAGTYLARVTVPSASKPLLLAELARAGIRPSTLFPDLEHLAAELRDTQYPE
jgi:hypothetical protein